MKLFTYVLNKLSNSYFIVLLTCSMLTTSGAAVTNSKPIATHLTTPPISTPTQAVNIAQSVEQAEQQQLPVPNKSNEATADGVVTDTVVPPSTTSPAPRRLWNLQDADILSVINEVSQETGKNFVVDPRVSGKITLVSSKPLRQSEVYQVFLSVLGILGYSAIPSGNVVKIVPNMESGEQATKVATRAAPGSGDEVVVRVIPLQNVSAAQLIPVLRPMLPQWSNVSAYTPGNVLILLGRASNLQRILSVVQDVDQASNTGIQVIPLHHATATQVAQVLNNLQAAARAAGDVSPISIAVDDRSNSILLGGSKAARLRMQVIVSQLDAPSSASSGNTEVIYLRYLQAKTLAPLLSKLAANMLGKAGGGSSEESTTVTATSNTPINTGSSSTVKETTIDLKGNILAEPNTNALIITAPPTLMAAIKAVIAKLDLRPAQVLIEAIIAEINESDLRSLGIQWGSVANANELFQFDASSVFSFPNPGAGIFGIMPHTQVRTVLTLLQNINGVDILSTPSVVVLDNQKATIEVGQEVSVQTGSYATTGGVTTSPTPFTTNAYKPVTLKLDVTPQINLGCAVRLKIALKNDTLQNPQNPGVTPLINTSKIANSVIINSEDTLVLGGLISNTNNENINKVPILGDLPILGRLLFQQRTRDFSKKNLMVFIKPTIINNDDDAMLISHVKYNMIRSLQANHRNDLEDIDKAKVENRMPPWGGTKDLPSPFGKLPT